MGGNTFTLIGSRLIHLSDECGVHSAMIYVLNVIDKNSFKIEKFSSHVHSSNGATHCFPHFSNNLTIPKKSNKINKKSLFKIKYFFLNKIL